MREPEYGRILDLLDDEPILRIAAPTLLECAPVLSSRSGVDARPILGEFLLEYSIDVINFSAEHYGVAVDAFLRFGKGRHPAALNFGDCISYSAAIIAGMPLLFIGNDFVHTDIRPALH